MNFLEAALNQIRESDFKPNCIIVNRKDWRIILGILKNRNFVKRLKNRYATNRKDV